MHAFIERGGHWVAAQFILFALVLTAGLARPTPVSFSGHRPIGWVIGIVGLVVAVAASQALGRNLTPFPKPLDQGALVERGAYRVVRHPIYSGVILIMIGFAVAQGDWLSMGLALTTIPFFYAKTSHEERHLVATYPAYADYRTRVKKRIVPGVL